MQFTEVAFGGTVLNVPAGSRSYRTTVPMTSGGKSFQVQIELGLRADNAAIFATFLRSTRARSSPPTLWPDSSPPRTAPDAARDM